MFKQKSWNQIEEESKRRELEFEESKKKKEKKEDIQNFISQQLVNAINSGDLERVKDFFEINPNYNPNVLLSKTQESPLHIASLSKKPDSAKIVEFLINKEGHKANPYFKNGWNETPIDYAISSGNSPIIKEYDKEKLIKQYSNMPLPSNYLENESIKDILNRFATEKKMNPEKPYFQAPDQSGWFYHYPGESPSSSLYGKSQDIPSKHYSMPSEFLENFYNVGKRAPTEQELNEINKYIAKEGMTLEEFATNRKRQDILDLLEKERQRQKEVEEVMKRINEQTINRQVPHVIQNITETQLLPQMPGIAQMVTSQNMPHPALLFSNNQVSIPNTEISPYALGALLENQKPVQHHHRQKRDITGKILKHFIPQLYNPEYYPED